MRWCRRAQGSLAPAAYVAESHATGDRRAHPRGPAQASHLGRLEDLEFSSAPCPAHSTGGEYDRRPPSSPRAHASPRISAPPWSSRPTITTARAANELWTADFKGQFRLRTGAYCYPLTVADQFSRYLPACPARPSTGHDGAQAVFHKLFREYGLPLAIRTDNGSPFASSGLARLSRLSVWWIKLGIHPELIQPASPQQNGTHERMHRTLKAEATRPPAAQAAAQQRCV